MWTTVHNLGELIHIWPLEPLEKCMTSRNFQEKIQDFPGSAGTPLLNTEFEH